MNQITPILFAKASSPKEMTQLNLNEIEETIRSCGLFKTKAKAIKNISEMLMQKYHGQVPKTIKQLEQLPGVGRKTAAVVMSQAFNKPAFPVDTHIKRCAVRWGLSKTNNLIKIEKNLKKIFPRLFWNKMHLQIIYYARQFCKARGHKIEKCPICLALTHLTQKQKMDVWIF